MFMSQESSIDCLAQTPIMSIDSLGKELKLNLTKPTALITLHPESVESGGEKQFAESFFNALEELPLQYIITYPNGDPGSEAIINRILAFQSAHPMLCAVIPNLGLQRYVSAMKHCTLMIGNSSSGLVEAPFSRYQQ